MTKLKTSLLLSAFASGLPASNETSAYQAEAIYELPDVVVTGLLWESELQSTTASVSAIGSQLIQRSGAQHFEDIINTIPNLTWSGGSSRPRFIQIRGIGENSQFEGETPDSSVRFLVDDLDFTGLGTIGNLFDVQQVEVLRGPQAGAFGVNAAGGVIKIVSNDPTPYWTGQAEATIGEDALFAAGYAIGGPLNQVDPESLSFRLSVHQLNQDGFRDNAFLNRSDTNERDELTTRLKLRWKPNEDWQWDGTLFYADVNNGYDEWTLGNTDFTTYSDEPGRDQQQSFATSISSKWKGLRKVNVNSTTSLSDTQSLNSADGDWTNALSDDWSYDAFITTTRNRQRLSEDIRLDSVDQVGALGFIDRWTAGFYFEKFEEDTIFGGDFGAFETTYKTQNLSIYGQATHTFSARTHLTLGLRAENFDINTYVDYTNKPDSDANPGFDDTLLGGKLTVEHDVNESKTLFGSITRGYKAGGANIYPELEELVPTSYDTEYLWNYEIGLRSEWLEGAITSQFTIYYFDREDAQLRSSAGQGIDFTYATSNSGNAQHYGAELESTWVINKNWSFNAGLGLLETELNNTGDKLSSAPSYTYSTRIDYVAENGFFANLELAGSDEFYESNNPDNRDQRIRSKFSICNSVIGYRYEDWTLTIWGRNIFDKEYEKRIFYFGNEGPNYTPTRYENPANPQQFGVTVNYQW